MSASSRTYFVGGNWKCNGTKASVEALCKDLSSIDTKGVDVIVAPISLHLLTVQNALKNMKVSAQNVSATKQGAYTGEIAADQLADAGIEWTIIGHSERRHIYKESDETIADKVGIALDNKLNVIGCLGETLDERKAGKVDAVCHGQLKALASKVGNRWNQMVIAYEPVWAIGTGETCPDDQAQACCQSLRKWLADNVSADVANSVRILYGGSVKPSNCEGLIKQADIDGFLVGGASLKADQFGPIVTSARK